jgi:hypothetical protein
MIGTYKPSNELSDRLPSGIPDKFTDAVEKHFKVVETSRPPRDGDLNEFIQANGGHIGYGGNDEAQWFWNHKGYSERI